MKQVMHKLAVTTGPHGFRAMAMPHVRGFLCGVLAARESLSVARRITAAVELGQMPFKDDLAFLGVQDTTPFHGFIGK